MAKIPAKLFSTTFHNWLRSFVVSWQNLMAVASHTIRNSAYAVSDSLLPTPDSLFPTPDKVFPTPDSVFLIPDSVFPTQKALSGVGNNGLATGDNVLANGNGTQGLPYPTTYGAWRCCRQPAPARRKSRRAGR